MKKRWWILIALMVIVPIIAVIILIIEFPLLATYLTCHSPHLYPDGETWARINKNFPCRLDNKYPISVFELCYKNDSEIALACKDFGEKAPGYNGEELFCAQGDYYGFFEANGTCKTTSKAYIKQIYNISI
jgi:hypothetical protein